MKSKTNVQAKHVFPFHWPSEMTPTLTKIILLSSMTYKEAEVKIEKYCSRYKATDLCIHSNMLNYKLVGTSTAVMVTFTFREYEYRFYSDAYMTTSHNLVAIAKQVEHMFGMYNTKVIIRSNKIQKQETV